MLKTCRSACWLGILFGVLVAPAVADADAVYTQEPTVAASIDRAGVRREGEQPRPAEGKEDFAVLNGGPAPQWIWGDRKPSDQFWFRKVFETSADSGMLIATCDNQMTVWLNGKQVASSSQWETPVRTKLTAGMLKSGRNELLVSARNAGGAAGFLLKLAAVPQDGKPQYVVTDDSWEAGVAKNAEKWSPAIALGKLGVGPWNDVFSRRSTALANVVRDQFETLPGFQVELLFTVPKEELGSWVSLTFDPQGRLIVSDQGDKGLCRVTPPPIGSKEPTKVQRLDVKLTSAQGMLFAFDSFYCSVNGGPGSGLYRLRDTNGDDQFDEVTKLKALQGGGEHGPHALRLSPDGQSIFLIAGNHTDPPADFDASRIPSNWGEDLLLPRQWDARGHARGKLAPGGWVARTDPDGKTWEIYSIGYRNAYDMDFNADGELFAYDADMEWDMGSPWYRPTRVCHAASGSEFGWRSGTGKWPTWYADSLPPVLDIGPGSPVGVTFGYGAKFPAKYQRALYLLDWTFGTIYAAHMEPDGASYVGRKEEFLSRTPLPLTDAAVGPDGALYFTVGGRNTQSELYRVTYIGDESTAPAELENPQGKELRALRRQLEELHRPGDVDTESLDFVISHLGHQDRFIRYAARLALEHREPSSWQQRVLQSKEPRALINGVVAVARQGDPGQRASALEALQRLNFTQLDEPEQLALLRAYGLIFIRMGEPDPATAQSLASRLDPHFPAESDPLNRELSRLLVYLKSPTVITKALKLLERDYQRSPAEVSDLLARNPNYGGTIAQMLANQPELEKIHLALVLRNLRYGWTLPQRQQYFEWLAAAREKSGGASYQGFIDNIRKEALDNASEAERRALEGTVTLTPPKLEELPQPKGPGRDWTVDELTQLAAKGLSGRDFENGRRAYASAQCVRCHRFDGDGGATGPDLTNVAGRFTIRDLAEALVEPSKVISDQYRASTIVTVDGKVHNGRILSEQDGKVIVLTDPVDATKVVELAKDDLELVTPSKVSLMPKDLVDRLNSDELLDLMAYLLSRGNPGDAVFAERSASQ